MKNNQTTTEGLRERIHKRLVDCYGDMAFMVPGTAIKVAEIAIADEVMQLLAKEKKALLEELIDNAGDTQFGTIDYDALANDVIATFKALAHLQEDREGKEAK